MTKNFIKTKVKKINIKKASLFIAVFGVLFFSLLSFNYNKLKVSADPITPIGDVLYTDEYGNKFYINCFECAENTYQEVTEVIDLSLNNDNSIVAYYFNPGVVLLDGEGPIKEYTKDNCPFLAKHIRDSYAFNKFKPIGQCRYLFSGIQGTSLEFNDKVDFTAVTDASYMFYNRWGLFTVDFSDVDTSKITNMSYMFANGTVSDVTGLDCSSCTNMSHMFDGNVSVTLNLDIFNANIVTDMSYMFNQCRTLKSVDFSNSNIEKVTNMSHMFSECYKINSIDFTNFNSSDESDMSYMFNQCYSLTSVDFSNSNIEKVTNMNHMFNKCYYINSIDFTDLNTSNVTDMSYMFSECSNTNSIDFTGLNTSVETDMSYMFNQCNSLISVDFSNSNIEKVTNMNHMFKQCNAFKSIDFTGLNTSNVTDTSYMFQSCNSATSLDFTNFNTSNITDMSYMFYCCKNLQSIKNLNLLNNKVTNMEGMFNSCNSLKECDFSKFNTSYVTNMKEMFLYTTSFTTLDLSKFDTSHVTDMTNMFSNGPLRELNISSFDLSSVESGKEFSLANCTALRKVIVPKEIGDCNIPLSSYITRAYDKNNMPVNKTVYTTLQEADDKLYQMCNRILYVEDDKVYYIDDATDYHGDGTEVNAAKVYFFDDDPNDDTDMDDDLAVFDGVGAFSGTSVETFVGHKTTSCKISGSSYRTPIRAVISLDGYKPTTCAKMFFQSYTPNSIEKIDLTRIDVSDVENMYGMFENCRNLKEIIFPSDFVTSSVTRTENMFNNCESLQHLDVSMFDTRNVNNMNKMFYNCKSLEELDLKNFNFDKVEQAQYVFDRLESITYLDISNMDYITLKDHTGALPNYNVRMYNIEEIFLPKDLRGCPYNIALPGASTTKYPIYSSYVRWKAFDKDGKQVDDTIYTNMISQTDKIKSLRLVEPKLLLTIGDTKYYAGYSEKDGVKTVIKALYDLSLAQDKSMCAYLFKDGTLIFDGKAPCKAFANNNEFRHNDIRGIVKKVYASLDGFAPIGSIDNLFTNLTYEGIEFNFDRFNTTNVTSMKSLFSSSKVTSLDLRPLDTSSVTDMSHMFNMCDKLQNINLTGFKTGNVTKMTSMFNGCKVLQELNVKSFDTSKVTEMGSMFSSCEVLQELDCSNFDTSNVTQFQFMFCQCNNVEELDLSNFDFADALYINSMFAAYEGIPNKLKSVKLGTGAGNNITNMTRMFYYCNNIISIDMSNVRSISKDFELIFEHCDNLQILKIDNLDLSKYEKPQYGDKSFKVRNLTNLKMITMPFKLDESGDTDLSLPVAPSGFVWELYDSEGKYLKEITELVPNTEGHMAILVNNGDIEQRMIDYQTLPPDVKEYYEKDKDYSIYVNNLFKKYYDLLDSYKCETIKDLSKEGEFFETFGVINRLDKDDVSDPVTLEVEKIIDSTKVDEVRNRIKEGLKGKPANEQLATNEDVLVPYDIKLMCKGQEAQPKEENAILVKIELPIEYYYGVINVVREHEGEVRKLIKDVELWKNKTNLGGKEQLNLYFYSDKFSTFTLTTDVTSVVVQSEYEDGVDKTKNYIVGGNTVPFKDKDGNLKDKVTVQINLDPTNAKALVYEGDKLLHTLTNKTNTFTVDRKGDNHTYLTIKYVKVDDNGNGGNGNAGGNGGGSTGGSITTSSITIQVSDHKPYINGYTDGTFKANRLTTRAEFAKIISSLSQNYDFSNRDENIKLSKSYSDIDPKEWYASYIGYATKVGIMEGYPNGEFKPNGNITRAEVCKVLNNMFDIKLSDGDVNQFIKELRGRWYEPYVTNLVKGNYIKGYPDGTFKPNENITRAEIVSLVNRVINREVKINANELSDGYKNTINTKLKDVTIDKWYYLDVVEASVSHNSKDMH